MPASRRSVSRAPRPQGFTPASSRPFHSATAWWHRQHDLEAVLAGVAGAGDEQLAGLAAAELVQCLDLARDRRRAAGHAPARARSGPAPRSWPGRGVRLTLTAERARLRPRSRPGPCRGWPALTTRRKKFSSRKYTMRSSTTPPGAVEHAGVERLARGLELVDVVGDQPAQERAHVVAAAGRPRSCARRRTCRRRGAPGDAPRSASRNGSACPSRRSPPCARRARGGLR